MLSVSCLFALLQLLLLSSCGFSLPNNRCLKYFNNDGKLLCTSLGDAFMLYKEDECMEIREFRCPVATKKVLEVIPDPDLCGVHHVCHRGTELKRICCPSTHIFNLQVQDCIPLLQSEDSELRQCRSDSCSSLVINEMCGTKIIPKPLGELRIASCLGTTTINPNTTPEVTTTDEPTTPKPATTEEPTTPKPETTEEPTTPKPATTEELTTPKPETTEEPTTPKPETTEEPTTPKPGTTEEPTTPKPATTEELTTPKPATTEELTTPKPETTEEPTTPKPGTTEEPTTPKPATTEETTTPKPATTEETTTQKPATTEETTTTTGAPTTVNPYAPLDCSDPSNNGQYYADPFDPQKYYVCRNGEVQEGSCLGINEFDCVNHFCTNPAAIPPQCHTRSLGEILLNLENEPLLRY